MRDYLRAMLTVCLLPAALFAGDVFDKHTAPLLTAAIDGKTALTELSMQGASELPVLAPNLSNPCLIVKTNDGNLAKVLVSWGYRRGADKPVPVVLVDRFVTYRADRENVAAAVGKEVMIFSGFSFNFDIGQIVPDGQGGDVRVSAEGNLQPVGKAEIYAMNGSQLPKNAQRKNEDPNDHEGVLPRDFTGTWIVSVDGRWKGEWELTINNSGKASGTYTSTESKSSYDVTGRVAAQGHNLKLEIHLDNATQTVDAYLWTTDKSTLAGTSTLAGRTFGFHATRSKE